MDHVETDADDYEVLVADEVYVDTDGDGYRETVPTGSDAAPFPVDPTV